MKKVLILGVNGFIGHHLSARILKDTDWHVYGMDMDSRAHRAAAATTRASTSSRATSRSTRSGSSTTSRSATWCCRWWRSPRRPPTCASRCGCSSSTSRPTCRSSASACKHSKRVLFPVDLRGLRHVPRRRVRSRRSSDLVYGPIDKQRWIYACSKQLLDRVIYAYGCARASSTTRCSGPSTGSGRASTTCTRPRKAARA